jgi:transcriptional regulator with XRE-family HTH domain
MKKNTHLMTKKKMTVHLGEVLREARLKAELTQADVAERVGVATEVYGRMERGHLTPSVPNLRKLCMVLRVDASIALGLKAGEAAAWLKESEPTSVSVRPMTCWGAWSG